MKKIKDFDLEEVKKMDRNSIEFKYFCYVVESEYRYKKDLFNEIIEEIGIDTSTLIANAKSYRKNDLHDYHNEISANQKRDIYIKNGFDKASGQIAERLLKADNDDEIIDILSNAKIPSSELHARIYGYIVNMYHKDSEKLIEKINKKLDIYKAYLRKNRQEILGANKEEFHEVRKSEALKLAKEILEHDDTTTLLKQIPANYYLGLGIYYSILHIWKEEKVYDAIVEKLRLNRERRHEQYEEMIRKILPLTEKNAIKVGERYRSIDIIDLYSYFAEDIDTIIELCKERKNLQEDDIRLRVLTNRRYSILKNKLITNFGSNGGITYLIGDVNVYDDLEIEVINRALNNRTEINCTKFDENNSLVLGSGYVLTEDDKKHIFKSLHALGLPVTISNYDAMVRHFNDGQVELITKDNIEEYLKQSENKETKGSK